MIERHMLRKQRVGPTRNAHPVSFWTAVLPMFCVQICRLAVPSNRSMLFRVASAITSTSSTALLSAAAQVWGREGGKLGFAAGHCIFPMPA